VLAAAVSVVYRRPIGAVVAVQRVQRRLEHSTHTQPFNGPLSATTQVSRYRKGKTNLDFAEARDSEWQWHPLGHMQVCTSLQSDNHASTPPLSFLQAGCPSCRPTNSVKALKAETRAFQFGQKRFSSILATESIFFRFDSAI